MLFLRLHLRRWLSSASREHVARRLSRFVVAFLVLFLLLTPLMEHVFDFDHFATTGHDFELETVVMIGVAAFYLLLAILPRDLLRYLLAQVEPAAPEPLPGLFARPEARGAMPCVAVPVVVPLLI